MKRLTPGILLAAGMLAASTSYAGVIRNGSHDFRSHNFNFTHVSFNAPRGPTTQHPFGFNNHNRGKLTHVLSFDQHKLRDCKPTSVPEPGTMAVLGTGLLGLGWLRRRNATVA